MKKEVERLKGLIDLQGMYISFLSNNPAESIAYIHGFKHSEDAIEKGKIFRELIESAKQLLNL